MGKPLVSDDLWEIIEPLLPGKENRCRIPRRYRQRVGRQDDLHARVLKWHARSAKKGLCGNVSNCWGSSGFRT
jgi:transposase